MSYADWAWLAGFIDGDGYFTCAVWERIGSSGIPSIVIAPRVGATQVAIYREVLDHARDISNIGKVYIKKEKSNSLNASLQATWVVSRLSDIEYLCNNLLPYIVLKHIQCEIMSELVKIRREATSKLNRFGNERALMENTLKCAELGLSLNPHATNGRNSRQNSEHRKWTYWKQRIPEVYEIADEIIRTRKEDKRTTIICNNCGKEFQRLKCNIKTNSKNNYCSKECLIAHRS